MELLPVIIGILFMQVAATEQYNCPETDVNFWGNDLCGVLGDKYIETESWHDCGTMCNLASNCDYWTFDDINIKGPTGRCYLKSSDGGFEERAGFVSGVKGCQ